MLHLAHLVLHVWCGTSPQEFQQNIVKSFAGCKVKSTYSLLIADIHICFCQNEFVDNIFVTVPGCQM